MSSFKPLFPGVKTPDPNNPWGSVLDSSIPKTKTSSQSSSKSSSGTSKKTSPDTSKISKDDLNSAVKLFNAATKRQSDLSKLATSVDELKADAVANQKAATDNYIAALKDQSELLAQDASNKKYYNYYTGEWVDDPSKIKPRFGMGGAESGGGVIDVEGNTSPVVVTGSSTGGANSTGSSGSSSSFTNGIVGGSTVTSVIQSGTSSTPSTPGTVSSTPSTISPITQEVAKPPVKTAPINTVSFDNGLLPIEILSDLIFEDLGGQELISIARNDTVNGQNIIYQPIKNLYNIQQQYNPNNIVYTEGTSDRYFRNFPIKFESKVPNEGTGPNGEHIYFDSSTKSLIIEAVNMQGDEQIEVQLLINGTIYEAEL